ncbi:MAG: dihydropteroate synthase [Bacteroidetes bacterium]|nr:dihydropteroate synthase [Bacteroidota bacterium]
MRYRFGSVEYDFSQRTYLMGIVNVTPDSFSDGGKYYSTSAAVDHALQLIDEGADIIDIGGESTRPGSDPVAVDEEIRRTIPVIDQLSKRTVIPISIDTYKSEVARAALDAGASIVNDISGMTFDIHMADVVAESNASVVLMHIQGTPKTMQEHPTYNHVTSEVFNFLEQRAFYATQRGIRQIIVDPGIGFGKTFEHNIQLIRELSQFKKLGYPLLVGPSRKSFIGAILNLPPHERVEGTAAAVAMCILNGAQIVRVHDVKVMKRVAQVVDVLKG